VTPNWIVTSRWSIGEHRQDRKVASVDGLTGAYLRGAGFAELEREMARAKRMQQPVVVAFVDVDRLKGTNDSRGHAAGDQMLIDVTNAH
jgi:diguanylate cyclase